MLDVAAYGGVVAHAGATCAAFGTTIAENRGGGNVGCFDAATCRLEDCDVAGAVGAMSVHCSRATMTLKNTRVGARDPGGPGVVVSGADSRTNRAKMKLVKAPPSRLYVSGGVLNSLMVAMHPRQDPGDAPWAALFAERTRLLAPLALRAPTAGSLDGVACAGETDPVEVCGVRAELTWLVYAECADGSHPFEDGQQAHAARSGNVGPGGRCGSIVDLYMISCPEETYEVYMDMYMCGADESMQ